MSGSVVVVDTNILFSALLKQSSRFAQILLQSGHAFCICESVLVELFKRKEKIRSLTALDDDDLVRVYHILLRRLELHKEDLIALEHWKRAAELCRGVDVTDTPHVALSLSLGAKLWTGDRRLREGLEARGFHAFFQPE